MDVETAANSDITTDPNVNVVPGYELGEIPPTPMFTLMDLALVSDAMSGFTFELTEVVGDYRWLTVALASCTRADELTSGIGNAYLCDDGSGTFKKPDGKIVNYGESSENYTINGRKSVQPIHRRLPVS